MHTYSVWTSEQEIETAAITASLARAQAERGDRVLVIDFTAPGGGLTEYFDVESDDRNSENIVSHLIEENDDPFEELIQSAESDVDIIPTHDHLGELDITLGQNASFAEISAPRKDYEYPKTEQLHRVISESKVFYEYDIILIDAGSGTNQRVYNAVYAAPNVLIPFEAASQFDAIENDLDDIEDTLDSIDVGVLGTVATRAQADDADGLDESSSELPATEIVIEGCPSLFEDARVAHTSFFEFKTNGEYRQLEDHEEEVLESIAELAEYVTTRLKNPA